MDNCSIILHEGHIGGKFVYIWFEVGFSFGTDREPGQHQLVTQAQEVARKNRKKMAH